MSIESTGFLAGSAIDANTVDTFHASQTPTANTILPLDANAQQDGSTLVDSSVQLAKLAADLRKEIVTIPLRMDGSQGPAAIYFPYKVTVNKIRVVVQLVIGAGADGTVTGANATGDSANGVVTVTAGAVIGTEFNASPTTNNVVAADSYYRLTSAKGATVGGIILATLEVTRTA